MKKKKSLSYRVAFNQNFEVQNNILTFKTKKFDLIAPYILRIFVIAFWIAVIYNICTLNFLIADEAPLLISIFLTLLFFISGLFFTFFSLIFRTGSKPKEFIDKNTGVINLASNYEQNYTYNHINELHIKSFITTKTIPNPRGYASVRYNVIFYSINLVLKNEDHIQIFNHEDKDLVFFIAKKLNVFFEKPLTMNFEESKKEEDLLKKENENYNKKKKINKKIKTSLIYSSELLTSTNHIKKLKKIVVTKLLSILKINFH